MIQYLYTNPIENLCIYSSFLFFLFFLFFVLLNKTASGRDSYSQVNKVHKKIFILYLVVVLSYFFLKQEISLNALLGLLVGTGIYFSLHYIYLFALIGLAKKSISVNILVSINHLNLQQKSVNVKNLAIYMNENDIGIGNIRESRLLQMTNLGFADLDESNGSGQSKYQITIFGKKVHQVGSIILKIWNQKRL